MRKQSGFTLIEIMIIVALIGLLVVLAMPSYVKVRKQSQGRRVVNDARIIDTTVDAWAMEKNRADGSDINMAEVAQYSKSGALPTPDVLGNPYVMGKVGTNQVRVSTRTKSALTGVSVDWGAY